MINTILVILGIFLFCYSIIRYIKFFRLMSQTRLRKWWQGLFVLIIFFAIGYAIFAYILVCNKEITNLSLLTKVVSLVFFFGAIFVVMTTDLIHSTILNLRKEEKEKRNLLQKTVEKLKKINKHLEELDKMKTEFLTIVSHQLRTPTSIIKGMLSMLVSGQLNKEDEKEFLQKTFRSAERLEILISNLLIATRLEGGLVMMKMEAAQLDNIIEEVINTLKPVAQEKNLSLSYEKTEQLPKTMMDSEYIKKAILNLVDNSLKYTKQGSVTIKTEKKEDEAIITIKDTGIGFREDEKKRVFKKFFRADKAMKLSADGSGLGLFIAQKIVEEHNGRIEIESKGKDKGSTFRLILPFLS